MHVKRDSVMSLRHQDPIAAGWGVIVRMCVEYTSALGSCRFNMNIMANQVPQPLEGFTILLHA